MLLFWKWKEVFCGTSLSETNDVRDVLMYNNIKYIIKTKKHDSALAPYRSPARNLVGRAGENIEVATMYYVYVYKKEYEKAKHVINIRD